MQHAKKPVDWWAFSLVTYIEAIGINLCLSMLRKSTLTFQGFAFGREIEAQKLVLLLMFNRITAVGILDFSPPDAKPLCVPCICRTHPESFSNSSKIQISVYEPSFRGVIFPEGASPLRADWKPESLASCKVVYREVYTEGSRTAKVCTDEQKVHKRHNNEDEYPQQYEVQNSVLNMLLNQIIVM